LIFVQNLFGFILPDNFLQHRNVFGKCLSSGGRQSASRERSPVLIGFGDGNITFLLQGFDVRREISVGHRERVAQFREGQFRRGGEHGHDRQPAFLMNHAVEL
jgi:hypothetical protein